MRRAGARSARARGATFAALLLAVLAPAPSAATAAAPRTSLPAIERQVMCVTCKIPLMVAQSPQADRERAYIRELIARGEGEAQIKRALVGQYGQSALALPATNGFDLAAYLVPVVAVAGVLILLALALPRWRRRGRAHAVALGGGSMPAATNGTEDPLDPAAAARLEADLARFD